MPTKSDIQLTVSQLTEADLGTPLAVCCERLYTEAFPPEERAPFEVLLRSDEGTVFLAYSLGDGRLAGIASLYVNSSVCYVYFLAAHQDLRGVGVGSAILADLRLRFPRCALMLEIEEPVDAVTCRRLRFYLRNGFFQTHIHVTQWGVPLQILSTDAAYTKQQYSDLWAEHSQKIAPHLGQTAEEFFEVFFGGSLG